MRARYPIAKAVSLLAAAVVLFAAACDDTHRFVGTTPAVVQGDGHSLQQYRPIGGCSRVDLNGVGALYIRQGAQQELYVVAEENLLEYLHTDARAGELVIWKEGVTLVNTRPIEYHLTLASLESAALTGAGAIHAADLDAGPLELRLTGVGTVEFVNLHAPTLDVETSGVGDVMLSGSVEEQSIELRAMGNYDGRDLDSAEADVLIANGGSATVRVRDRLSVTIHGSGSVYYIGNPVVDRTGSGSGDVVKIGG